MRVVRVHRTRTRHDIDRINEIGTLINFNAGGIGLLDRMRVYDSRLPTNTTIFYTRYRQRPSIRND